MFSSIIMIILVRTKHWNLFAIDISGLVSILMYNNSASSVSLVCDLNYKPYRSLKQLLIFE